MQIFSFISMKNREIAHKPLAILYRLRYDKQYCKKENPYGEDHQLYH